MSLKNIKYNLEYQFKVLCEKYNITNCKLVIGNRFTIIDKAHLVYPDKEIPFKDLLNICEYVTEDYLSSFMMTDYDYEDNNIHFTIVMATENILNLYYSIAMTHKYDKFSGINDFCEMCLQHEIGHVLDITSKFNKHFKNKEKNEESAKKWIKNKHKKDTKELNKYIEYRNIEYNKLNDELITDDEYIYNTVKAYYEMTAESDANKAANIDIDKLIELTIKYQAELEDFENEYICEED